MTIMHCSLKDGSTLGMTRDENFGPDKVSEEMLRSYYHIEVAETLESLMYLVQPVMDDGDIVHKALGYIDLNDPAVFPPSEETKLEEYDAAMEEYEEAVEAQTEALEEYNEAYAEWVDEGSVPPAPTPPETIPVPPRPTLDILAVPLSSILLRA